MSARATSATTPSPYPCHSPVSCGPSHTGTIEGWSGVKCLNMHTKLKPRVHFVDGLLSFQEIPAFLSLDFCFHSGEMMRTSKGTKVLNPSTSSPHSNPTNNILHLFQQNFRGAGVLTQADLCSYYLVERVCSIYYQCIYLRIYIIYIHQYIAVMYDNISHLTHQHVPPCYAIGNVFCFHLSFGFFPFLVERKLFTASATASAMLPRPQRQLPQRTFHI